MVHQQTLADSQPNALPTTAAQRGAGYFAAYPLAEFCPDTAAASALYGRKDFYKIVLVSGHHAYEYSDRREKLVPGQPALVFTNRQVPYRWELHSGALAGYGCVFTEEFLPRPTAAFAWLGGVRPR